MKNDNSGFIFHNTILKQVVQLSFPYKQAVK